MSYIYEEKKIAFERVAENVNVVKLASVYDHNCSEEDTVILNDVQLQALLDDQKEWENSNHRQRDYAELFPKTDSDSEQAEITVPSAEDTYIEIETLEAIDPDNEKKVLLKIFSKFTDKQRRRLYLNAKKGLTYDEIAEVEGVGMSTVRDSIKAAENKLKMHRELLLNLTLQNWLDLLIDDKC